jgi:hypothetical protein
MSDDYKLLGSPDVTSGISLRVLLTTGIVLAGMIYFIGGIPNILRIELFLM